jgi:hypothetical protein
MRGNTFPLHWIANSTQAQFGEAIQIVQTFQVTIALQLVNVSISDAADCTFYATPQFKRWV